MVKRTSRTILLLIFLILLTACSTNQSDKVAKELGIQEQKPTEEIQGETKDTEIEQLSTEEAKEIVETNLIKIEEILLEDFSDEHIATIDQTILDSENDDDFKRELVEQTKGKLEPFISQDKSDEITRMFLHMLYLGMHKEYLNVNDMQARFEIIGQKEDSFQASFLTFADEAGYSLEGKFVVTYNKENDHWVFVEYNYISPDEEPFHLTFADIEEYYDNIDMDIEYEEIEEVDYNGEKYLVIKILENENMSEHYVARNVKDSTFNFELAASYE